MIADYRRDHLRQDGPAATWQPRPPLARLARLSRSLNRPHRLSPASSDARTPARRLFNVSDAPESCATMRAAELMRWKLVMDPRRLVSQAPKGRNWGLGRSNHVCGGYR